VFHSPGGSSEAPRFLAESATIAANTLRDGATGSQPLGNVTNPGSSQSAPVRHALAKFVAECRILESLMNEPGHDRIDLLKLEVEGAEYEIHHVHDIFTPFDYPSGATRPLWTGSTLSKRCSPHRRVTRSCHNALSQPLPYKRDAPSIP
jgi:hypothetical protein